MVPLYVIIPVYNAEKYLAQTVDSVLKQNHENIRIILVDDGSKDGSAELCDKLAADCACIHVIHQENGGVSCARNTGIEYALQEAVGNAYFAFLDADDLWHPGFLDTDILEEIEREQHDIYAFGTITSDENAEFFSVPQPYNKEIKKGGKSGMWLLKDHFAANLYHISLFRDWDIRFFDGYKYSEDKYFKVICSFFAKTIAFSSKTMYIYRENSSGAMSSSSRVCAVDYFGPIIDGWMQTEKVINSFTEITGVTTDLGRVLGNVYLLDMITTHYMQWGSRKKIEKIVTEHPNYPYLLDMKPMGENDVNYKRKTQLFAHPVLFAIKCRMLGLIQTILRIALKIPVVQRLNERRKHPLNYLP